MPSLLQGRNDFFNMSLVDSLPHSDTSSRSGKSHPSGKLPSEANEISGGSGRWFRVDEFWFYG
jgi:hypothetical protein